MKINKTKIFNDDIYTPLEIAKDIVGRLPIKYSERILDPCYGEGVFYFWLRHKSHNVGYCETKENIDFFEYNEKVTWIVTNPPYSKFTSFMEHAFKISENVIFLVPLYKIFASNKRLNMIDKYGSIHKIFRYPTPKEWTINFPIGAVWFKRKEVNNEK